jgi:O-antigen ligase
VALGIFALIVLAGPLLFGAVDRLPQIGLLVLLTLGILALPPAVVPLSRWGNRLAIAFVALLIFKEFAPAVWFGDTSWRSTLTREFSLELPFTHHPEPSRALDGLLVGAIGLVWFLWVRRLAGDRSPRTFLAWTLFASAAIVAIVSFATRHAGSDAIYGLRFTPGWSGFGPFPNRNHTADFFAMSAVLGCGCLVWAVTRKQWGLFCGGLALLVLILVALLTTQSRGGIIAFAGGAGTFLVFCLARFRNGRTVVAVLGAALLFGLIGLTFGAPVMERFKSHNADEVSVQTRVGVWRDTISMWRDAPLLGHGLDSFTQIFPLYQTIPLENQMALHPESSWLQWLAEIGALPVLIALVAVVLFISRHVREMFGRQSSFFLHAAGISAFLALIVHSIFDVPAHRWGTAGFALAALALACPMRLEGRRVQEARRTAFVPLVVAAFWALPLLWSVPAWSPLVLIQLIEREAKTPRHVQLGELQTSLRFFPLNPELHQSVGLRQLYLLGRKAPTQWQREFAIAARLQPSSWYLTMAQAQACQRVVPELALKYWQETVDRGGIHREELLGQAVQETARIPAAQSQWDRYVEAHPPLLLAYAQCVPPIEGSYYFGRWWKLRGEAMDLSPTELRDFYLLASRWGKRPDFETWMKLHADWAGRDYRAWAAVLHASGDDERAWQLLSVNHAEPAFPPAASETSRERLEANWRLTPRDFVSAQQLAMADLAAGDKAASDEVILAVARGAGPPPWFVDKAAWVLAHAGRTREAVALLLQPR